MIENTSNDQQANTNLVTKPKLFIYEAALNFLSSSTNFGFESDHSQIETYFLKDRYGRFVIVDSQYSIKCVFDGSYLNKYRQEMNIKIESLYGKTEYIEIRLQNQDY